MRRQLLDQMIDEQLVIQQAERDTAIQVSEQEVQDAVEQTYQNVRRQFTSDSEFESQLRQAGFASPEEWRRYLAEQQRRSILRQRLVESLRGQGKLRPIPPTDSAMRAYWEQSSGQLPRRPPVVSFRQVVVVPQADSAALQAAYQLAESLVVELRRGRADFAAVARRSSDDTLSRAAGGELGWFRRGVMVRDFENAAFAMRPGQISDPVLTEYGFHIIKVERAQPAEIFARHILITPEIGQEEIARARQLADSIHDVLGTGAPFDSLARRFSDPQEPRLAEDVPISELPPEYRERLTSDSTTGLKPPFVIGAGSPKPRFVILQLLERQGEGAMTYEEMKGVIRERLSQDLAMRYYLRQLRNQTYVDVRL
jgi:peptidyl-prolyl cis-trans isomerase SurA